MEYEKQLNESEMIIREIISNIQEEAAIKVSVYEEKLEKLRASFEVTKSKKMECEKLTVDLISLKEINANHLTILDAFEKNLKMIQINNPVNYSLEIS